MCVNIPQMMASSHERHTKDQDCCGALLHQQNPSSKVLVGPEWPDDNSDYVVCYGNRLVLLDSGKAASLFDKLHSIKLRLQQGQLLRSSYTAGTALAPTAGSAGPNGPADSTGSDAAVITGLDGLQYLLGFSEALTVNLWGARSTPDAVLC